MIFFEFDKLPPDLQVRVCGYITPRTLNLLDQTSHSIRKLIHDHAIWRDPFDREFDELNKWGVSLQNKREITQITAYKEKYKWLTVNKVNLVIDHMADNIFTVAVWNLWYNIDESDASEMGFGPNKEREIRCIKDQIKVDLRALFSFAKQCENDSTKRTAIASFASKQNPLLSLAEDSEYEDDEKVKKLPKTYDLFFDFVMKETSF